MNIPWNHATIAALAGALGVTDRSLELWRKDGCPLATAAPFDELAVRIWYVTAGPGSRSAARTANLKPPTEEPLNTYCAALRPRAAAAEDDPDATLKRERAIGQRLLNESRRQTHLAEARSHFDRLTGALLRAIERETGPVLAEQLWQISRAHDRLAAEPGIQAAVRTALEAGIDAALRADVRKRRVA